MRSQASPMFIIEIKQTDKNSMLSDTKEQSFKESGGCKQKKYQERSKKTTTI